MKVRKVGNSLVARKLRILQTMSLTKIEFDVLLEQLCVTNSCDNSDELSNNVFDTVSSAIMTAIGDSSATGFAAVLVEKAKINGVEYIAAAISIEGGDFGR